MRLKGAAGRCGRAKGSRPAARLVRWSLLSAARPTGLPAATRILQHFECGGRLKADSLVSQDNGSNVAMSHVGNEQGTKAL